MKHIDPYRPILSFEALKNLSTLKLIPIQTVLQEISFFLYNAEKEFCQKGKNGLELFNNECLSELIEKIKTYEVMQGKSDNSHDLSRIQVIFAEIHGQVLMILQS